MEQDKLPWVVCLTLFLVIGLNFMIYAAFKGKESVSIAEALRRASKGMRNPWEAEDAALSELSRIVVNLETEKNINHEAAPDDDHGEIQSERPK